MATKHGQIKWNIAGFQAVRRMPGVEARLRQEVDGVLSRLPDGFDGGVGPGRTRSRGYVVTATGDAVRHNAETNALLRALGGGA